VIIAQITDTHVRRKGDLLHHMIHTGRELRRAVAVLNAAIPRPAMVVATGDLVERGLAKEYRRLRKILAELELPVYLVPGNHDDRDALREGFPEHRYLPRKGPLSYVIESRPVRLIALDTTRGGRAREGELDATRLAWLDETLSLAPAVPTLVAMHHPPFDVGIGPVDRGPLRGRDEFARVIAGHPQVARIVCGQIHRFHAAVVGGAEAVSVPSTAHQLILGTDGGELPYAVRIEPPALALHRWTGRTIVTALVRTNERAVAPLLRAVS
jgi:3',5'-cyclic AMP phosphodiesterase CpdA